MGLEVGAKKRIGDLTAEDLCGVQKVELQYESGETTGSIGRLDIRLRSGELTGFDVMLTDGGLVEVDPSCPAHKDLILVVLQVKTT